MSENTQLNLPIQDYQDSNFQKITADSIKIPGNIGLSSPKITITVDSITKRPGSVDSRTKRPGSDCLSVQKITVDSSTKIPESVGLSSPKITITVDSITKIPGSVDSTTKRPGSDCLSARKPQKSGDYPLSLRPKSVCDFLSPAVHTSPTSVSCTSVVRASSSTVLWAHKRDRRSELIEERIHLLRNKVWSKHRNEKKCWIDEKQRSLCINTLSDKFIIRNPLQASPLVRFRRYVSIVRTLCSIFTYIRKQRFEYDRSAVKLKPEELNNPLGYHQLGFDIRNYHSNKEFKWPDSAKPAIRMPPHARSDEQCATVCSLMRTLPSFCKYTKDMQRLLSRVVEYTRCRKNRVIVRKGHVGHSFYFVFSGICSVTFSKNEVGVFTRPDVIYLRKGDVFGESALLCNTVRNATVVSAVECDIISVDKEAFVEFGLFDLFMKRRQFVVKSLQRLDLFTSWGETLLNELCALSGIEAFGYNKIVERDVRESTWLYFVIGGSCDVLRLVDLTKSKDFAQLVPREEIQALIDQFHTVFFDLNSLHKYITTVQKVRKDRYNRRCTSTDVWNISQYSTTSIADSKADTADLSTSAVNFPGKRNPKRAVSGRSGRGESSASANKCRLQTVVEDCLKTPRPANADRLECYHNIISTSQSHNTTKTRDEHRHSSIPGMCPLSNVFSGVGVFVKVDTLSYGDYFGFQTSKDGGPLTLVSQGAELLRIPLSKFNVISDDVTKVKAEKLKSLYPSEEELSEGIVSQVVWKIYSADVCDDIIAPRYDKKKRDVISNNYFRRKDFAMNDSTSSRGLSRMSCTPGYMRRVAKPHPQDYLGVEFPKSRAKSASVRRRTLVNHTNRPKTACPHLRDKYIS